LKLGLESFSPDAQMATIIDPLLRAQPVKLRDFEATPRSVPVAGIREFAAIAGLVALADITIYRGAGYAGLAVLLLTAPMLLLLGSPERPVRRGYWVVSVMLLLLAARMLWLGSYLAVVVGAALLVAFVLALRGLRPYVPDVLAGFAQLPLAGIWGLAHYQRAATGFSPRLSKPLVLGVLLPTVAVTGFGTLFVLANPDLVNAVADSADRMLQLLTDWIEGMSQNWREVGFWLVSAYVAIGLLRPLIKRSITDRMSPSGVMDAPIVEPPAESQLYGPILNTLWAVIILFAAYLSFEFATLWFREFPKGFYYAGYAHEGAGWLTVALALATLVLSLIFRGRVLRDPRLGRLQTLAWIWSALNLLLAVTVYHRMYIYIDFNGMTRMRTIGLFGITTVLVGFLLVLWKIVQERDFLWLIQRQLWALAIAVYLFALTPVDTLVHTYNVRRILAGDLAPSVQISVHPISAEGYLVLGPLVDCTDPMIRDGIRAMLAEREVQTRRNAGQRRQLGWTAWQISEQTLLRRLTQQKPAWRDMANDDVRQAALKSFREYAYQWY
jgi:hypothetical protein